RIELSIKGTSSQDRNHADKSTRTGGILPRKMKPLWDEKLPRIADKGQHGLLDPLDPIQSFLACYYNTLCMMIFFHFQKYKFYRIKINKTVEIIQMYHTIIRQ
ncbi:MAG: hypothetical protein ACRD94_03765, partial [Nitrosopumilaceae archaeon]